MISWIVMILAVIVIIGAIVHLNLCNSCKNNLNSEIIILVMCLVLILNIIISIISNIVFKAGWLI